MNPFLLQDTLTIQGANAAQPIIQTETDWLDLSPYQDVVASVEVLSNLPVNFAASIYFETSPLKDERLFMAMNPGGFLTTPGQPAQLVSMLMGVAPVPLATFLRWKVIGSIAGWSLTFRIYVYANSPGSTGTPSPLDLTKTMSGSLLMGS